MKHVFIAAAACLLSHAAHAQPVIANPNVKAGDVSKSELQDIFTGGSSTFGGTHGSPVLLKSGPVSDEFLAAYVGKSDSAFRANWRSLVFSGQATMPKSLDSDAAVSSWLGHRVPSATSRRLRRTKA